MANLDSQRDEFLAELEEAREQFVRAFDDNRSEGVLKAGRRLYVLGNKIAEFSHDLWYEEDLERYGRTYKALS